MVGTCVIVTELGHTSVMGSLNWQKTYKILYGNKRYIVCCKFFGIRLTVWGLCWRHRGRRPLAAQGSGIPGSADLAPIVRSLNQVSEPLLQGPGGNTA